MKTLLQVAFDKAAVAACDFFSPQLGEIENFDFDKFIAEETDRIEQELDDKLWGVAEELVHG